ncbi:MULTISPECIES: phosphoglucosamine mutase [unclassified Gemella]|uniref:phosphoglucosamine mutase n=1 Tax=unclassified Gemella TaxID=2624949 RepID=UPI0010741D40|nr:MULTISPECIES: phosphoglucosamine mutase [unclassified Gemella]MBF0710711.1 phosphoglucosamine mutase [Gemella sp. GL1.1]MBF0746720.1 phosphoglucosamine mutase [Gemella sp. 19428wG2_WT2a]NYS28055.1 phosphoglucosamine mutase [Gemella sp. GL1]TFU60068.1 phosphoglucosamine mutase [Gemella sp. WT2a]
MRKYFGTDGIRGVAGESLTADLCYKTGRALGSLLISKKEDPKIIIGRDTRISCDMIESSLVAGLTSTGVNVMLTGVIPTPAIAYLTSNLEMDAGIMISASHNPYQDNGIKIFASDGFKLTDEEELTIEKFIDSQDEIKNTSMDKIGRVFYSYELSQKYIQHIKSSISSNLEGMKIVLDCAHGATTSIAPFIFGDLDADIETIGCNPNGTNINDGFGSTKLDTLANFVKENDVDLGFAFDGDGDRMLAVDNEGNIVDGDKIMFILAQDMKEKGKLKDNMVVSTVMSNLGFYAAVAKHGMTSVKTAVGDKYVVEEMKKSGYTLGGEQSGHVIMLEHASTGDGILTAVQLASILKKRNVSLKELADQVEIFPQKLVNIKVTDKHLAMQDEEVLAECKKVEEELGQDGRILLRASGTENLVRVMVEAKTDELTDKYCEQVAKIVREKFLI